MHGCAAACIVFAFLLLGLGAQALEVPQTESETMLVSLSSVGLAFLAFVVELVALGMRRRRL
jgi:membrane protein DedA with SNARE-associated domain